MGHPFFQVSKVIVVGAADPRGPEILGWDMSDSVTQAVEAARSHLGNPKVKYEYIFIRDNRILCVGKLTVV
jgi:hypothetical protein